jgi:hypothetical protein
MRDAKQLPCIRPSTSIAQKYLFTAFNRSLHRSVSSKILPGHDSADRILDRIEALVALSDCNKTV